MNRKWLFPFWKIPLVERFLEDKILKGHGRISHNTAKQKAIEEYQEFNKTQKIVSDFDKEIRRIKGDSNGKKQK